MTDTPRSHVLHVQDVTKNYGSGDILVQALGGVSLEVLRGEVVVIMGPSGAGKTTLLSIIGGMLTPTSGNVSIDGENVGTKNEPERARVRREKIGFVFQSFNLLDALSAVENVELVLWKSGIRGRRSRQRAYELLAILGLKGRETHRPRQLSGGEKQRVAIARALANNPSLILADEPTASLDSKRGRDIVGLLRMVARDMGKGVLIVSHDLRVRELADRILWLEDGLIRDISEEPGARGIEHM
jgi:putative ABC transport system ATP-binding protein